MCVCVFAGHLFMPVDGGMTLSFVSNAFTISPLTSFYSFTLLTLSSPYTTFLYFHPFLSTNLTSCFLFPPWYLLLFQATGVSLSASEQLAQPIVRELVKVRL